MKVNRRVLVFLLLLVAGLIIGGCALFRNQPPVASFTIRYNEVPGKLLAVVLNASGSTDPEGDAIVAYMWTFGDEVDFIQPLGWSTRTVFVPEIIVEYPVEGSYPVTLAVRDEKGNVSLTVSGMVVVPSGGS
jgi:PKD repeat protein